MEPENNTVEGRTKSKYLEVASGRELGLLLCVCVRLWGSLKKCPWLNFRLVMLMETVQAQQMRSVPTEVVCV